MKTWLRRNRWANQDSFSRKLMESLLAAAWFVEARDPYTAGHLWRVSKYSRLLADAAGMREAEAARISLGGFLHDVGKVGVPDAILRKKDRLTAEETAVMRTHPKVGVRMLSAHPLAYLVREMVGMHHERPDGRGYPNGLTGGDLPREASIIALCDSFDAMTSHRPYRAGMPGEQALEVIEKEAGGQFDPDLARFFVSLGAAGVFDTVIAHSDDGIPLQSCPMCGPTLAIRREQTEGEHTYCRSCGGEFEIRLENQKGLCAVPTGGKGDAEALEPEADVNLIARTVSAIVSALPIEQLLGIKLDEGQLV